jgi:hypothetical protein
MRLTKDKLRQIVREEMGELYNADDIAAIVRRFAPNAKVEQSGMGGRTGTGAYVTIRGNTYFVRSDLRVFNQNERKTEAAGLLETVINNLVR